MGIKITMKMGAILAVVAANRYDSMNEDDLLVNFESTLSSALSSEARGDSDAAVAKTAAIKNIQPQINDMERRLGIMQSSSPFSRTPSRPSKRSLMSEAWARNEIPMALIALNELRSNSKVNIGSCSITVQG